MQLLSLLLCLACSSSKPTESPPEPANQPIVGDCADAIPATEAELRSEFAATIAPLFYREQSEGGCVACHTPLSTHPIIFWEDVDRTFTELWSNGYLAPAGEAGSVLDYLDADAPIPMPLGGEGWSAEEQQQVQDFACRLEVSDLEVPVLCDSVDPGFIAMRRLSALEYTESVIEAVGADSVRSLPADSSAFGFNTVGSRQPFSVTELSDYSAAAQQLATETFYRPESLSHYAEAEDLTGYLYTGAVVTNPGHGGAQGAHWLFQRIRAYIPTEISIQHPGTYQLSVYLSGWAGAEHNLIDGEFQLTNAHVDPELEITVNGTVVSTQSIASPYESWSPWQELVIPLSLETGANEVAVWLSNASWGPSRQRDVELRVDWLLLEGPGEEELPMVDEDRIAKFVICDDADSGCPQLATENLLTQLWRRPVTSDEINRYASLMEADSELEEGLQLVLEAALLSPHFLFRPEPDVDSAPRELTGNELAVRLSYFLWSAPPDTELRALAEGGELTEEAVLMQQVERMLIDSRAETFASNFVQQWLGLPGLHEMGFDPAEFPEFDAELVDAMTLELEQLFQQGLRENLSIFELLNRDTVWLSPRMAEHYQLEVENWSSDIVEVSVGEAPRGGLLESAAFLTLTSHPSKTSPTKRGRWILEQLLCQPPEEPPDNVETDVSEVEEGASLQEMLAAHAEDPACASCHLSMDPMGITFEHFGPLGQWRTTDDFDQPVNSTAELATGELMNGHLETIAWLKQQPALRSCVLQKLLTYGIGQEPSRIDRCGVQALEDELDLQGDGLQDMIRAVVRSPLFRQRRGHTTEEFELLTGEAE